MVASDETHPSQQQPPDRLAWSVRYARPVLTGLLLIVVLAGVRASRPPIAGIGRLHSDPLALAAASEFVLAMLLVTLRVIARRRPEPGYPAGVLRVGLRRAILLGMAVVAVLAGLSSLHLRPGSRARPIVRATPKPPKPRPIRGSAAGTPVSLTYITYALLAVLLLAAIVACVVMILRRLPAGSAADPVLLADDDDASLRHAIESGRRALRSFDDAQAAIIACYVAMEASLARAGAVRDAAETPDELLARAAGSGLLQGRAAGRLTELFYEARYSSHALPASARDEAVLALDDISAELARQDEGSRLAAATTEGAAP